MDKNLKTGYNAYMRQYWILFTCGALIFFLPFLGFPSSWKTVFLLIIGLVISSIALSFIIKERALRRDSENQNQSATPHGE